RMLEGSTRHLSAFAQRVHLRVVGGGVRVVLRLAAAACAPGVHHGRRRALSRVGQRAVHHFRLRLGVAPGSRDATVALERRTRRNTGHVEAGGDGALFAGRTAPLNHPRQRDSRHSMKPSRPQALADTDASLDALIQAEQVRLLYRGLRVSTFGVLLGVAVVVLVFWRVVQTNLLVGWAGCMVANQVWRLVLSYRFDRRLPDKQAVSRWGTLWAIGSGISGVLWGAASFLLFVPGSPVHQAFLMALVISVTSAGLLLIGAHLQSFYAFILPAMVPLVVRNVIEGTTDNLTLALIAFVSGMALFSFGRNYNRILTESLRLRFENEAITRRLSVQNEELDRARKAAEDAKVQAEA